MPVISGGGGGGASVLAIVQRSSPIASWDGNALPFNSVVHDPAGLWDNTFHAFNIATAGWYLCQVYAGGTLGILVPAASGTGTASLTIQVNGAGSNIATSVSQHTEVASGGYPFPALAGVTHLDVGDSIEVDGTVPVNTTVASLVTFSIALIG